MSLHLKASHAPILARERAFTFTLKVSHAPIAAGVFVVKGPTVRARMTTRRRSPSWGSGRRSTTWRVLRQGLTLVPVSAQLEITLPRSAQLMLTLSPVQPKVTRGCVPRVLKLSSNVSDVFPKVLKLSFEVSECKPLHHGVDLAAVRLHRGHHRGRGQELGLPRGGGLHSSTFQLNLSRFGLTSPCSHV
jgi:hypothetical protein